MIVRMACAFMALTMLTGCGCVMDPGDEGGIGGYWDGCWGAAKREDW